MPISANIYEKCLPAVSNDIDRCGAVSLCSIAQATGADLDTHYGNGDDEAWSILDTMLRVDYEAKACQIKQNSLYDIIYSMTSPKPKSLDVDKLTRETWMIRPFVNVFRNGIINNKYWAVSGGQASGETNWQVDVENIGGNIPSDVRWFPAGVVVYIESKTGAGVQTNTAWEVVSSSVVGAAVRLILSSMNASSHMPAAALASPTTGTLTRGLPSVDDYQSYCNTIPGLNTRQQTQAWIKRTRLTLCRSEMYEKYHKLLKDNNPRYKQYGDIDTLQRNQQALQDYQNSFVEDWFWGKGLSGQNQNDWQSTLPEITIPTSANLVLPFEGTCVGREAHVVGYYEQLWQCDRVFDFGGARLNLWEFFKDILYPIKRYRKSTGGSVNRIEVLVSTYMKFQIQMAMTEMFNTISGGAIRYPVEIVELGKNNMGFEFDVYRVPLLGSTQIAFISHEYFDDRLDANTQSHNNQTETMWIIDWPDIKTWLLDSNRKINESGTAQEVARVDDNAMCIMERPKRWVEMISEAWTMFVECPGKHAIFTNMSPAKPVFLPNEDDNYPYSGSAYP